MKDIDEHLRTHEFLVVKAILKLRSTEEGGRQSHILDGYRPNHVFAYRHGVMVSCYMGDIKFEGEINPGEEREVTVRFIPYGSIEKLATVGRTWWIHEGSRVVGEGKIIERIS